MVSIPKVSPQRSREIVREIARASSPRGRFFVLLITASMIASFGLIANSAAVIIGAMLVSPLMTPIFGLALGMLRGNPRMLGRALRSELMGIVLAVGAAYLVGLPQLSLSGPTPEMLARTQPTLIDLLVAVVAGFAGTYALLDERVSPALPGVAIATAIVPPLSTCGICLALGAWSGASGAMLLFLANFVSILVVALLTFWGGGLGRSRRPTLRGLVMRFGPTVVAFAVIGVILTNSLIRIARDRRLTATVHAILERHLDAHPGARLDELQLNHSRRGIQALATVWWHEAMTPAWVSSTESDLETTLASSVDLVVRTIRSRDVCGVGSSLQVVNPDMDGNFLVPASTDFVARESLASQVIREHFEGEPGFELMQVEYGVTSGKNSAVVAHVSAIRPLMSQELAEIEDRLRKRLQDPTILFFARVDCSQMLSHQGPLYVEWTNFNTAEPEQVEQLPKLEEAIVQAFQAASELVPTRVHFHWSGERWRALTEVIGPGEFTPRELQQVQEALPAAIADGVEILVWRRSDFVITPGGYSEYQDLLGPIIQTRSQQIRDFFRPSVKGQGQAQNTADVD